MEPTSSITSPLRIKDSLRVLLSWETDPRQVPPIRLSDNQVTLCTANDSYSPFTGTENYLEPSIRTPRGSYDIFNLIKQSDLTNKEFDLVVIWSSPTENNMPYNTKAFSCPTVLIVGDTHHLSYPISKMLTYATLENFDYIVSPYNRQHLHWFTAAGFSNLAWLPLISMYTIGQEWTIGREERVAFIGSSEFHPRRKKLLDLIKESEFSLIERTANRKQSAEIYSQSLISFNCSLNGDLNLRVLEVISAGGFLLTDRLSSQSGLNQIMTPGIHYDEYNSESELIEKIAYYTKHPEEALNIAHTAYQNFFESWHPNYRINNLFHWIFDHDLPDIFSLDSDPYLELSRQNSNLLETRLTIYEQIQELHRVEDYISVLLTQDCPIIIATDLTDLPRIKVYIQKGENEYANLTGSNTFESKLIWVDKIDEEWDICITKGEEEGKHSRFRILLDEDNQIMYSSLAKLMSIQDNKLSNKNGSLIRFSAYEEEATNYVLREIFHQECYPFLPFVKEVSVILDIGANAGFASIYFRLAYPNAQIFCFEPDPIAQHLLKINAARLDKCSVYPVGLYSDDIDKIFYTGLESTAHSSIHQSSYSGIPQILKLRRASSFLNEIGVRRIDILKVDTEGCEVEILRSLIEYIPQVKVIYLEFHSEEDRRLIDQLLSPTHLLWKGTILDAHRGDICYLHRSLTPQNSPIEALKK